MTFERERLDEESASVLRELWETPVGRRWVLKAGLGSAAALAAQLWAGPVVAAAAKRKGAVPPAGVGFQFALGGLREVRDLVMVADGKRVALLTHTSSSRKALRARGGLWRQIDLGALTHHVPAVSLPTGRSTLVSVYGIKGRREVLVAQSFHVPQATTLAMAKTAHKLKGSFGSVVPSNRGLRSLGLTDAKVSTPTDVVQLGTVVDRNTTAAAIVALHPQIATKDSAATNATNTLLLGNAAVASLANAIKSIQDAGGSIATQIPATDPNGSATELKIPIVDPNTKKVTGYKTTGFATTKFTDDQNFRDALSSAVISGIREVRDTSSLGAVINKPLDQDPAASTKTWVQPDGVIPTPKPYPPASPSKTADGTRATTSASGGLDIQIANEGLLFGTYTIRNGTFANSKMPLRIYNNWVRWIWVYVQYLGTGDTNLSIDNNAKFPDTKYSKSVAVLPQVFTVLGVPIWDTNTIDVTLDFPPGAYKARLLYAGLGSNLNDGNWRQYFPADAYPDKIAPTDEVLFPALITGIFTIGLTVFALAADMAVAEAFASVRGLFKDVLIDAEDLRNVIRGAFPLTASESAAVALAAGSETYTDVANRGQNLNNLWNLLLGLASVIPKLLFNPNALGLWAQAAEAILSATTADKLIQALPAIGQVIAVIEAVGDVATLAEVGAESVVAPWVIENEVSLTYAAMVTVSHDPCAPSWPVEAKSWSVQAKLDGQSAVAPVTGSMNVGGRTGSDPLVLRLTAPFGGSRIQWSVVVYDGRLDASNQPTGNQIASGVSAELVNNDQAHPPEVVAFAVRQAPEPIVAATVFKRADTTTFSKSAGGYTWSDQIVDTGTVTSGGRIEAVTGVTVASRLGVVGVVWEQAEHYYLRGIPIVENGSTFTFGAVTRQGYARRPFLLFDSWVDTDTCAGPVKGGNHVLLEPDPVTDAYHVRMLTVDPDNGALSWDTTKSYGTFALQVSAAALHSSGRVIAIHTDTGRIGQVQPTAQQMTPQGLSRPSLAGYTAGPGSQIGLLQSPIAIAITHLGAVMILEAAVPQVSAWDLNGNPLPYFQSNVGPPYALALENQRTYLDLAVDGANQIYTLSYSGDGSQPQNYKIDVYTPSGTPLATNSPGTNIPHFAVDFWRSVYAANYNPLTDQATNTPHLDPTLGVAEPSISRFDPTTTP